MSDAVSADGIERRLHPDHVTVQRIVGLIFAGVVGAGVIVAEIVYLLANRPTPVVVALWLVGGLVLTALLLVRAWFWPAVRHRHVAWRLDPRGLRIDRGVWWKSTVSVPRSRVQHTDVQQGPIDRSFGLAALVIHTAGTEHASITLSGLSRETAIALRDRLLEDEGAATDSDG